MSVEAAQSGERQIVQVTWDTDTVTGELVVLHCVNPDNGDVSVSGPSKNDGTGYVTYPPGYSGQTVITVLDNDENTDSGTIKVEDGGAETVPPDATEPPEPPDLGIWPDPPEGSVLPEHPIVIPPDMGFNPPDSEFPEHPEPI
jgi:hypothetical protein